MPKVPIILPQLGESIAEATVVRFCVEIGQEVKADQEVVEVETNKAVMGVTTPCRGIIKSFSAEIEQTYPIGTVLGFIEASAEDAELAGSNDILAAKPEEVPDLPPPDEPLYVTAPDTLEIPASSRGSAFLSPKMRARLEELGLHAIDSGVVPGTGIGGRVTVKDLETYLDDLGQLPWKKASAMRLAVADSMRRSWTRPLATLGIAVGLEKILLHRKTLSPSPGPALYVAKALAMALTETPEAAGRLIGDRLVLPGSIDIGVAVEVEEGVIVPVFPSLDQESLADLSSHYLRIRNAARERRLPESAKRPAIASVTNYGTLGIDWATPIPLPTETLIVGLGRGEKVPVWEETKETFVPQVRAELTLSFDHRVIDGAKAGRLVHRIRALFEAPESL